VNQAQVRRHGAVLFACLTCSLTPIWVHDQYSSRYVSRFKHPVDAGPTDPKVLCDVGSAYFKVSQKVETHSCKCLRNGRGTHLRQFFPSHQTVCAEYTRMRQGTTLTATGFSRNTFSRLTAGVPQDHHSCVGVRHKDGHHGSFRQYPELETETRLTHVPRPRWRNLHQRSGDCRGWLPVPACPCRREHAACFSRPICRLAMLLNDHASDEQRQKLLPFVSRLACADAAEVEQGAENLHRLTHEVRSAVLANARGPERCTCDWPAG
jgi:hypothetical protein